MLEWIKKDGSNTTINIFGINTFDKRKMYLMMAQMQGGNYVKESDTHSRSGVHNVLGKKMTKWTLRSRKWC